MIAVHAWGVPWLRPRWNIATLGLVLVMAQLVL